MASARACSSSRWPRSRCSRRCRGWSTCCSPTSSSGLAVLALYLVLLRADALARWERVALYGLIAFSAATHSATLLVLAGLAVRRAAGCAVRSPPDALRAHRPGLWRARAWRRAAGGGEFRRGRAARLDAGRHRHPVRPHAADRHRRALSRRSLPRPAAQAVRPSRGAADRRRRVLLGRERVRPARPLRRHGRGDAHHRGREPDRLSVAAVEGGGRRHRRAARQRRHRLRRQHRDLAHLRHDRTIPARPCSRR